MNKTKGKKRDNNSCLPSQQCSLLSCISKLLYHACRYLQSLFSAPGIYSLLCHRGNKAIQCHYLLPLGKIAEMHKKESQLFLLTGVLPALSCKKGFLSKTGRQYEGNITRADHNITLVYPKTSLTLSTAINRLFLSLPPLSRGFLWCSWYCPENAYNDCKLCFPQCHYRRGWLTRTLTPWNRI